MRSRPDSFKKFVGMLRNHLDGILPWTKLLLSNGAVEGMNNNIRSAVVVSRVSVHPWAVARNYALGPSSCRPDLYRSPPLL